MEVISEQYCDNCHSEYADVVQTAILDDESDTFYLLCFPCIDKIYKLKEEFLQEKNNRVPLITRDVYRLRDGIH
jgi:hypothetical protein